MNIASLPAALRSWQHLRETKPELALTEALPIQSLGTTYMMAQELSWIDFEHFAVGRWDGSMSIFKFTNAQELGPLITKAVNTPSAEGVQMITWIAPSMFVTSNDDQSAIVWTSASGQWDDLAEAQTLKFDVTLGVANSGTCYTIGPSLYLLIGHANGYVTIWLGAPDGTGLTLIQTINTRSAHPVNPWNLYNVRGLSMIFWGNDYGYAVSGSEDGDLCIIRVPDGAILSRMVYNPNAQRGINSLDTFGQNLLVANCAVGSSDNNLWYYWIDANDWSINLQDAKDLQIDQGLPQVFNFDVSWGVYSGGICWLSATQEGYLWMGTVTPNRQIKIIGNQLVTPNLGAALGMCTDGNLAVAAYDLYEFNIDPNGHPSVGSHPQRFVPLS